MKQSEVSIHSTISNDRRQLDQFLETLGDRLEEAGIEFIVATRVQVCLDEMLSNALDYGYPPEKTGEIEISIAVDQDEILVTVSDDGIAFNPFERDLPDSLDKDLEERDVGGLGIHIVKSMARRFAYQRVNDRNINTFWLSDS